MKAKTITYYLFVFIILVSVGCAKRKLPPDVYVKWITSENNGLKMKKIIGEYEYTAIYEPIDYIALKNLTKANKVVSLTNIEKEKNKLGNYYYFTLKIQTLNGTNALLFGVSDKAQYYKRINYFSYDAQADIRLIAGEDTIPCNIYHFERNYNLAPYILLDLGFARKYSNPVDLTLSFTDNAFDNGIINIRFEKERLKNIPELDIKKY